MKRKNLFLSITILLFTTNVIAQCMLDKTHWRLYFAEEFNANKAALNTNWIFREPPQMQAPSCSSTIQVCYDDALVNVSGGIGSFGVADVATPFTCDPSRPLATSKVGIIGSTFDEINMGNIVQENGNGFMYGMFEIRCKFPKKPGTGAAFWLSGANSWPPEIDIFEYKGGEDNFGANIHWYDPSYPYNDAGCQTFYKYRDMNLWDDWHTYTAVWTPTEIAWFLDGKEIRTDSDPTHLPNPSPWSTKTEFFLYRKMHIIVQNARNCGSTGVFDDFEVDYVRVYKPNNLEDYVQPAPLTPTTLETELIKYYNNCLAAYASTPYKTTTSWVSHAIVPDNYFPYDDYTNPKRCIKGLQGGGKFVYQGKYNLLWITYWDSGVFKNVPMDWVHQTSGDISLAGTTGESTFYIDINNQVCYFDNGVYTEITGANDAKPRSYDLLSSVIVKENADEVFYLTTNNTIKYSKLISGVWTTPVNITPSIVKGSMIFDPRPGYDSRVYFINTSNELNYVEFNSSSWIVNSVSTTVSNVESDLAISPDGINIYYRTQSGTLKYFSLNTTTSSYTNHTLNGKLNNTGTSGPINNVLSDIIVYGNAPNSTIFYIGTDYKIWTANDNGVNYTYNILHDNFSRSLPFSNLCQITIGSSNPSNPHMAYIGNDYRIRTLEWYNGCDYTSNPPCGANIIKRETVSDNSTSLIPNNETSSFNNPIVKGSNNLSEHNNDLVLYPNPTNGISYLEFSPNYQRILLYNAYNSLLGELPIVNQDNKLVIDLRKYPKGIYFLKVESSNKVSNFKLIKN